MTVKDLIEKLKEFDPDLLVCYRCYSEQCLLEAKDLVEGEFEPPRDDGWVHNCGPKESNVSYLVFPGN